MNQLQTIEPEISETIKHPVFISAYRISRLLNLHHDTTKKHLKALKVKTYKVGKRHYYKTTDVLPLLSVDRESL